MVDKGAEALKTAWLARLDELIGQIEQWAHEWGWSTRRIDKGMQDSEVGDYRAPVLFLQGDLARILVEPIARSAPGTEGVVDLYLMPAYDDIASLYLSGGVWHLHYLFPGQPTFKDEDGKPFWSIKEAQAQPLSRETLNAVLEEMKLNAASPV